MSNKKIKLSGMKTSSLIIMSTTENAHGRCPVYSVLYQKFNGSIDGVGKDLLLFLKDIVLIDGFTTDKDAKLADGACCLFAQIIAHFKKDVGGAYLFPTSGYDFQEFNYYVHVNMITNEILFSIRSKTALIFEGTVAEALEEFKYIFIELSTSKI
jgi:hypothetical protein